MIQAARKPRDVVELLGEQRLLLHDISWRFYERFLAELGDRPNLRLTYDRGSLEIMSTSPEHERYAYVIGWLISLLGLELSIPVMSGRTTTLRRKDRDRGLEPDNCYWVRHARKMLGRKRLDLTRDPPPDLAIEVTMTTSLLDRLAIFAGLQVPELWQFDGKVMRCFHLSDAGEYELRKRSLAFPFLAPVELAPFVLKSDEMDDSELGRKFVSWIHQHRSTWKVGDRD